MPKGGGPVIWVVEDDMCAQELIARNLRVHGFSVVLFDSAEKAFESLSSRGLPGLIVLDMLLPGMSGVDLIRLLKQNWMWEKIPVVVVSVLSRKDASEAPEDDFNATYWMNKPFETGHLIETVQGILASVR